MALRNAERAGEYLLAFHNSSIARIVKLTCCIQLRQEYENTLLEQPYYLSEFKTAQIVRDRSWGEQEKLDELQGELRVVEFCRLMGLSQKPHHWIVIGC